MPSWRGLLMTGLLFAAVCCVATVFVMENSLHVAARRNRVSAGVPVGVNAKDGVKLRASWLEPASGFDRCVLILHGIADSRASSAGFAPVFLPHGYAVLAPDSRAHGESGGSLVTYGLLERDDTLLWANWMRAKGCKKIYGLGESLGASVLLQAAALEPAFSAIVAESSFADLQDAAEARLVRVMQASFTSPTSAQLARFAAANTRLYARIVHGIDLAEASPLRTIRQVRTPMLLIHGLDDDQTPPEHSRRLAAANPAMTTLWLVPGVRHQSAYSKDPGEWRRRVLDWFANH